jgi:hypothetical protein
LTVARNQRSLRQLSVGVTIGSLLSIALFSLLAIIVFAGLRRNFFGECYELLLNGKAAKLQFGIYPVLFSNSVFSAERATVDAEFSTSLRNTLVGAFICSIQLTWIFRPVAVRVLGRVLGNLILWSVTLCGSFLVVTSVSRSNVAVLGITFVLACLLSLGVSGRTAQRKVVGNLTVLVMICLLAGVMVATVSPGVVDLVQRRFAQGSPERIAIARQALREISEQWLIGRGIGARPHGTDLEIHNLLLAAWHSGGLGALLMSLGFYLVVVVVWIRAIRRRLSDPAFWKLDISANWVLTLPLLPLFRALISGEGGNFSMIEWTCLAVFFALMSWNASAAEISMSRLVRSPNCAADFMTRRTGGPRCGSRQDKRDLSQAS